MATSQGDITVPGEKTRHHKRQEQLDEYLVKETFVPTGNHGRHSNNNRKMVVRRRKQKEESPLASFCAWVFEHQLGMFSCIWYSY